MEQESLRHLICNKSAAGRLPQNSSTAAGKGIQFHVGVLAVFFFALSALAADTSVIGRLRQYGIYLQSGVRSTPDGDHTNRWSAPGAPLLGTFSGAEANHALTVFQLSCASVVQPPVPSLRCETLLRHSR
jgi:hypothetical protein